MQQRGDIMPKTGSNRPVQSEAAMIFPFAFRGSSAPNGLFDGLIWPKDG